MYVCGVIISMSKELNFESQTWVMVVKHVYEVQLTKLSVETGKVTSDCSCLVETMRQPHRKILLLNTDFF